MGKSVLYAANLNSQAFVPAGLTINFGNVVRRYGCNCGLSDGVAEIRGSGYYFVDTNISFNASAGTVFIQIYKDGVAIPGAEATITTEAGIVYSVTIPAVVRQTCGCEDSITVIISGATGTVNNAAIIVEKL